jgi:hypothetical protein
LGIGSGSSTQRPGSSPAGVFGDLEHTRLVVDAAPAARVRQAAVVGADTSAVRERIATEAMCLGERGRGSPSESETHGPSKRHRPLICQPLGSDASADTQACEERAERAIQ